MPIERWTTAQVLALAPDAGSAKGARSVSSPGKWEQVGLDADLVWGLCRGSGKNPYQTCVDLTEPAYRCSCPSRKFPCKHALGLLLLWSAGEVSEQAAPEWVAEWREKRAARADRATTRRAEGGPADPAAARKRAEQRAGRVAAGLAELDRWLLDQVGQGLAGAERSGHQPYETMAARLVDAQAPGAAGSVRRLGHLAGVGANWADRLLGELAMLRLLVAGHERIAELPAPLAATVRSRIGIPSSTEEVLANPPLRDHWQVLGQVDAVDDRLTARRTWLYGVDSGRFALLLAFAAPGQSFPADLPLPGSTIDAELCWYPGSHPLRALVARRHGVVRQSGTPAGARPVAAALAEWSAALAGDPWCERVPMLLADVVPTDDGHLLDQHGDALPLRPGDDEPWWLLAAAGGRPTIVSGEYDPTGFRPLAAWLDGTMISAVPGPTSPARPARLPEELLSSALVGTDRRPHTGAGTRVGEREIELAGHDDPAAGLLEAAAVALTYQRAGARPVTGLTPVDPAPGEHRPPVPSAAARRLARLLSGEAVPGGAETLHGLLGEWLRHAASAGCRAPAEMLPALLDHGRRQGALRADLATVAGRRGGWLATRHPDWRYLLTEATPDVDPADWETGTPGQRLSHLLSLRRADPDAGRELLVGVFDSESAEERARLLGALSTGLSAADEPLLEQALRDRSSRVRDVAAELLVLLPGSAYGHRMAARSLGCVRLEPDDNGRERMVVTPPTFSGAELRRDGMTAKPPRGVGARAWLLEEIVARTPLGAWTATFGRSPAELLALPVVDDWKTTLRGGFTRAAVAQRDRSWALALVDRFPPSGERGPQASALYELLPPEELARQAERALRHDPTRAQWLVVMHPGPWPDGLTDAVLAAVSTLVRNRHHLWHAAELCRAAGMAMPAGRAEQVAALAADLSAEQSTSITHAVGALNQLAATLTFRRETHEEFR